MNSIATWDIRLYSHQIENEIIGFEQTNISTMISKTNPTPFKVYGAELDFSLKQNSSLATGITLAKTYFKTDDLQTALIAPSPSSSNNTAIRQYSASGYVLYDFNDSLSGSLSLSVHHNKDNDYNAVTNPMLTLSLSKD